MSKQPEPNPVTRETLDLEVFLSSVQRSCQRRIERGSLGALSFDQLHALTAKRVQDRMFWKHLDLLALELVGLGKLKVLNGKFYVPQSREDVERAIRARKGELLAKSSAEKPKQKLSDARQVDLFDVPNDS